MLVYLVTDDETMERAGTRREGSQRDNKKGKTHEGSVVTLRAGTLGVVGVMLVYAGGIV